MVARKPNLLFIMADQLRWDTLGARGTWVDTPHLDQLAAEGTLYSNCYSNAPVCKPARISLATGRYPHNTNCWHNDRFQLGAEAPNWIKAIRNQGYDTALFGKLHWHRRTDNDLRNDEPLVRAYGFDTVDEIVGPRGCFFTQSHMTRQWQERGLLDAFREDLAQRIEHDPLASHPGPLPLDDYYDVYVARRARQWLHNLEGGKPWFCKLSFAGPHEPWDAPEPFASRYAPEAMPAPLQRFTGRPEALQQSELGARLRHSPPMDPGVIARCRANYAGNVTLIDQQIGEVIAAIRARGEWDNTVVIFTADHGEMNGDHGLVYKNTFLNGAIRVPLLLRLPPHLQGADEPRVRDGMVELMDVGATLAGLAGRLPGHRQFARPLWSREQRGHPALRDTALAGFKGEFMLASREHKLAVNRRGEPYLLFDLKEDPDEQYNRVADPGYRPVVQEMQQRLLQRIITSQLYAPPGPKPAGPRGQAQSGTHPVAAGR